LQYIVNSLLDLRLQVEDLRRRMDDAPRRVEAIEPADAEVIVSGRQAAAEGGRQAAGGSLLADDDGLEASAGPGRAPEVVVYEEGMRMADVERAAISAALKATRGNRRRAAEKLGIGERTLYRKLREYHLDVAD
jgi:DNA-binding NtrC family response regulator